MRWHSRNTGQSDPSSPMAPSRRRMLSMLVALAALAVPAIRHRIGADSDDDFIIVNGWILKKDDLEKS